MTNNEQRSRFVIWLLAIIIIVMSFLIAWKPVEEEAENTALFLASNRILERANYYKQEWLLKGQLEKLTINRHELTFSESGWALPIQNGKLDCAYWLDLLYPEQQLLGIDDAESNIYKEQNGYRCQYRYVSNMSIILQLKNERFSVNVEFLSL